MDDKNKKKTLTISTNITKKINLSALEKSGKKSFSIEKKKPFKGTRDHNKQAQNTGTGNRPANKRNFART